MSSDSHINNSSTNITPSTRHAFGCAAILTRRKYRDVLLNPQIDQIVADSCESSQSSDQCADPDKK
jgi:hypothetical protein